MSKKSRSGQKQTASEHHSEDARVRDITVKPIHALAIVILILIGCAFFLAFSQVWQQTSGEGDAPQVGAAPVQAGSANILPPGSLPQGNVIQVQPGKDGMVQLPAQAPQQQAQVVYPSGANRPDSTPEGFPSEGAATAPITILELADFQCPYCRQFAEDTLPKIREKYLKDGKVRLIWRDMSIRGPESDAAAAAALCAHEQGRFWPYHDLLYARAQGQNQGAFTAATLKAMAAEVGRIQPELFAQCLDTGRYLPAVRASTQDATTNLQLAGTPTFFVNGRKVEGNLAWEKWDEMLSSATQ